MSGSDSQHQRHSQKPHHQDAGHDDSDHNDYDDNQVVTYNSNHMYVWILAVTFVVAIIVSGYYSARFSSLLSKHSMKGAHQMALCRKIHDISVCNWFFVTIPVLNVGLAGGLAHNVATLAKACAKK